MVYVPDEAGTVPDVLEIPEPWRNQPYTSTYTRTTFNRDAPRQGRHEEQTFTVTAATRAEAKRRLADDLASSRRTPTDRHGRPRRPSASRCAASASR